MSARVLLLPGEEQRAAALIQRWQRFYNPQSPGAEHLLELCVRGVLLSDRCFTAHDTAVAGQVDEAGAAFDQARANMVADQEDLLVDDPAAAVAGLLLTGQGTALLIGRLERYRRLLETQGFWRPGICAEAIRLLGVVPDEAGLKSKDTAYMMMFCNLHCQPAPDRDGERIATLSRPEHRPEGLRSLDLTPFTIAGQARTVLLGLVDDQLGSWRARAEVLRAKDALERSRVVNPTKFIKDDTEASRFFRYLSESRTLFLRSFNALEATLERDAVLDRSDAEESPGAGDGSDPADVADGAASGEAVSPEVVCASDANSGVPHCPETGTPQTRNEPARTPPGASSRPDPRSFQGRSDRAEDLRHRYTSIHVPPGPGCGRGGGGG
jgi:hypothetical protein